MTNAATTTAKYVAVPKGTGESTRFTDDVIGVMLGLVDRDGDYEVTDPKTGEVVTRPNSYVAHFMDDNGQLKYINWPAYIDDQGQKQPWSRFDASIDLALCITEGVRLHAYRDASRRFHLKLATSVSVDKQRVTDDELF